MRPDLLAARRHAPLEICHLPEERTAPGNGRTYTLIRETQGDFLRAATFAMWSGHIWQLVYPKKRSVTYSVTYKGGVINPLRYVGSAWPTSSGPPLFLILWPPRSTPSSPRLTNSTGIGGNST